MKKLLCLMLCIILLTGCAATYDGPTSVEKGLPLNATVTVDDTYTLGAVSITMAGVALTEGYTSEGNVVTINIAEVTGTVVIAVATTAASGANQLAAPVIELVEV